MKLIHASSLTFVILTDYSASARTVNVDVDWSRGFLTLSQATIYIACRFGLWEPANDGCPEQDCVSRQVMAQKRKRCTTHNNDSPQKKPKPNTLEKDESDSQDYYAIKDILKETKTHYFIDWEGIDPKTEKPFEPTWEPKAFANKEAISSWEQVKRDGRIQDPFIPIRGVPASITRKISPSPTLKTGRRRLRIIVPESSSAIDPADETAFVAETQDGPAIVTSHDRGSLSPGLPTAGTALRAGTRPPQRPEPEVRILRPQDFDSGQYERFPDAHKSPIQIEFDSSAATYSAASPTSFPAPSRNFVPDSQSLSYMTATESRLISELDLSRVSVGTERVVGGEVTASVEAVPLVHGSSSRESGPGAAREPPTSRDPSVQLPGLGSSALAAGNLAAAGTQDRSRSLKRWEGNEEETLRPLKSQASEVGDGTRVLNVPKSVLDDESSASGHREDSTKDNAGVITQSVQTEGEPLNQSLSSETAEAVARTIRQVSVPNQQQPVRFRTQADNLSQDAQFISPSGLSGELDGAQIVSGSAYDTVAAHEAVDDLGSDRNTSPPPRSNPDQPARIINEGLESPLAEQSTDSSRSSLSASTADASGQPPMDASGQPPMDASGQPPMDASGQPPMDASGQPPMNSSHYSTLDSAAPPRPPTPLEFASIPRAMFTPPLRSSSSGGSKLGDKLKKMRAEEAAKRAARWQQANLSHVHQNIAPLGALEPPASAFSTRSTTESPGIIPANVPEPMETLEESRTSERLPTLAPDDIDLPVITASIEPLSIFHDGAQSSNAPCTLVRTADEYIVTLPADAMTVDQYKQTVVFNRGFIQTFTENSCSTDSAAKEKARELIDRLDDILTHVDLDSDGAMTQQTQNEIIPEEQVTWDSRCSTKFRFLQYLIENIRHREIHIWVVAKEGKTVDILETFFRGHHVRYERADNVFSSGQSIFEGSLSCTLLSSEAAGSKLKDVKPSIIIALDNSLDEIMKAQRLQKLCSDKSSVVDFAPIIQLVVYNSPQHIIKSIPQSCDDSGRLDLVVNCAASLRNQVGSLPEDWPGPKRAALEVGQFLAGDLTPDRWTLPKLERILEVDYLLNVNENDDKQPVVQFEERNDVGSNKRAMELDGADSERAKRPRLASPPENANLADLEVTRISDSAAHTTQSQDATNKRGQELEVRGKQQLSEYLELVASLRAQLNATETGLNEVLTKNEELRREIRRIVNERASSLSLVDKANRRMETLAMKLGAARDEIERLRMELAEAQALARRSSMPEIGELEGARIESKKLEEDNRKLELRLKALQEQEQYIRENYQTASRAAAEHAGVVTTLTAENEVLKAKASGEAAKVQQILSEQNHKLYQDEIDYLKQVLKDRDALIRAMHDEARVAKRTVGVGTRASSVPRSPKPGFAGSRQGSPKPVAALRRDGFLDARLHPLRMT